MKLVAATFVAALFTTALTGFAHAETRSLYLYNTHTHEKVSITFKKNGRYVRSGLRDLNRFLRDWRRNESIKMDPKLFDLIWQVYRRTGSRKPIHVVSGYRSPATNNMLRKRSRGVAKFSQHTLGKAMDFFIPGTSSYKIRVLGLQQQTGGVGYYPRSRSKFIHLDTGRIRHWPRMTRRQLVKVFPRGNTVHVPSDGKPLRGYKTALARVKSGRSLARSSTRSLSAPTSAYVNDGSDGEVLRQKGSGGGFLTALFGGGLDAEEDSGGVESTTRSRKKAKTPSKVRPGPVPPSNVSKRTTQVAVLKPSDGTIKPAKPVSSPTDLTPKVEPPKVVASAPAPKPRAKPLIEVAAVSDADRVTAVPRIKPVAPTLVAAAETEELQPDLTTTAALPDNKPESASQAPRPETVLAYAPAVPENKPGSVLEATRNFANSEQRASLVTPPPQPRTRPTSFAGVSGDRGTTIASRQKSDPFARFVRSNDNAERNVPTSHEKTRTMAFASLYHPDQRNLKGVISVPDSMVVNNFTNRPNSFGLSSDVFKGTAIASLVVEDIN